MTRIEKTVFISYRRTNLPWALAIFQNLKSEGYDVFFDYLSIPSGDFENIIVENIKARAHFIVILTPSALERCKEPGDWLRREIETAMDEKRNIVPLMLESFDFGSPSTVSALTGKLENLKRYNGLRLHSEYFFEGMNRLREQYLNVSLDTVVHPVSESTIPVIEEHKTAASEAAPVEKEELTAQEWFERGYVAYESNNLDEALRYFTEAIQSKPSDAPSLVMRAIIHRAKGDAVSTIADCDQAIKIMPDLAQAYLIRGRAFRMNSDPSAAIKDFNEVIRLMPNEYEAYFSRGLARFDQGDIDSAIKDYNETLQRNRGFVGAYYHRAISWEKKQNYNSAVLDYQKYLDLGGGREGKNQRELEERIKKLKSKLT